MERLALLLATHFIGDFPFQSEWMVNFKGKDFIVTVKSEGGERKVLLARWYEVLSYHVAVYVAAMYLFMRLAGYHPSAQGVAIDAATHFVIDTLKCRGYIKAIWIDQLCHLTVRTMLWWFGWL